MKDNKTFGIFIGLINKVNGTKHSVQQAAQSPELMALFSSISSTIESELKGYTSTPSTKSMAYEAFREEYGGSVTYSVYTTIANSSVPLSRREIARQSGIRLCTVCGRVAELQSLGLIQVVGKEIDPDSQQKVQVLALSNQIKQ